MVALSNHFLVGFSFGFFCQKKVFNDEGKWKARLVLVPEKDYRTFQKKAALKTKPEKLLSVEDAHAHSKKFIRKWAADNSL